MIEIKKLLLLSSVCLASAIISGCKDDDTSIDSEVKAETSINYTLTMSPDLLKFVTPQVKYVDENGNIVTLTGVEELDGKVIENKAEIKNGDSYASSWTSQVITGTGYKCWIIQMKFNRLNFHSYLGVKYIRNDFVEDTTGKIYDFHHNVNTSINLIKTSGSSIKAYSDSHVSVTLGNYKKGDDIEKYLDNLYKSPDRVGYFIDDEGNVTQKDKFEL